MAVALLAQGKAKQDVASELGVRPWTLSRWLRSPVFAAAVHQAQDDALASATRKLESDAGDLLNVLRECALDKGVAPGVRVRAVEVWLTALFRAREMFELNERIQKLEERIGGEK
jgi:hypothetical protein